MITTTHKPAAIAWEPFLQWAQGENEFQKRCGWSYPPDYPNPAVRDRTFLDENLYLMFTAMQRVRGLVQQRGARILDLGSWPMCWLRCLSHFAPGSLDLTAAGLSTGLDEVANQTVRLELDCWSPRAATGAPTDLALSGFTLVTAIDVIDRLYHPQPLFDLAARALAPGGVLFLTARNAASWQNLLKLALGDGLAGDVSALVPGVGSAPASVVRPRVRQYVWRELCHCAREAGFFRVGYGFFEDNCAHRLLDGEKPLNEPYCADPSQRELLRAITPEVVEPGQLASSFYLIFKKSGPLGRAIHRARTSVYRFSRRSSLGLTMEKHLARWLVSRRAAAAAAAAARRHSRNSN